MPLALRSDARPGDGDSEVPCENAALHNVRE